MFITALLGVIIQAAALLLGAIVVFRFHAASKRHNDASQRHNEVEAYHRELATFEDIVGRNVMLLHRELEAANQGSANSHAPVLDLRMFPVVPQPPEHHADAWDHVLVPGAPVFAVACAYVIGGKFSGVSRRRLNADDPFEAIDLSLGQFGVAAIWSASDPPPIELAYYGTADGKTVEVSSIAPANRPSYDFAVLVYKGCFVWAHRL